MADDLDNVYNEPHEICWDNNLGHKSDAELGLSKEERGDKECFVSNLRKREYYALSWEEIEDETVDGEFLSKLRQDLIDNKTEAVKGHLNGLKIHCPDSANGLASIKIEDLSLYRNVVMVRD